MSSQTIRPFSQEDEMSQLTNPIDSQLRTNYDPSNAEIETQNSEINSQVEETLSAKADAICEQNRQIRGFVEKNLKQIEKKRLKLINKKSEIEEKINIYLEKHKHQSQKSVELQMNIEGIGEQYENELNQRKDLLKKLENTQTVLDYIELHYADISKVTADLENTKEDLGLQFEKLSASLREKAEEKNKLKLLIQSKIQEKLQIAQATKELLVKEREAYTDTIKNLVMKNVDNGNKISNIQKRNVWLENKNKVLKDTYNDMIQENKSMKEGVVKLRQQVDELKSSHAQHVQNLKLDINKEKNICYNLQMKNEEYKNAINVKTSKKNELDNLFNQINNAKGETMDRIESKKKEIKECSEKKESMLNEIRTLEEKINNCDNASSLNTFLKNEISSLEDSNKIKEQTIRKSDSLIENIIKEVTTLKTNYLNIQQHYKELRHERDKLMSDFNEVHTKLEADKKNHQLERETKILELKSYEESNSAFDTRLKSLGNRMEECQIMNSKVKTEIKETQDLIEFYSQQKEKADEELKLIESDWEEKSKAFQESIDSKINKLDKIEDLIVEARPYQDELALLSNRKQTLNQDIQQKQEKHLEANKSLERNFNSKLAEISGEKEKYISIMGGLIKAEEEATKRLKEEVKKTKNSRRSHEIEFQNIVDQVNKLKKEELTKRHTVAKLEKRLKTINKEIQITRQDINDAITGNTQTPVHTSNPTKGVKHHSLDPSQHVNQPRQKMVVDPDMASNMCYNEIQTKQWVESSFPQDDEYEFSEI